MLALEGRRTVVSEVALAKAVGPQASGPESALRYQDIRRSSIAHELTCSFFDLSYVGSN